MSARITESQIQTLVHSFYERVREDDVLGPVFEASLAGRWDPHLAKMCDFWSSVLLATGRFRGNPVAAHRAIPGISSEHFDRWIELFESTAFEVLPAPLATDVVGRSLRMRVALEGAAAARAAREAHGDVVSGSARSLREASARKACSAS